jgi:hypothetical protein
MHVPNQSKKQRKLKVNTENASGSTTTELIHGSWNTVKRSDVCTYSEKRRTLPACFGSTHLYFMFSEIQNTTFSIWVKFRMNHSVYAAVNKQNIVYYHCTLASTHAYLIYTQQKEKMGNINIFCSKDTVKYNSQLHGHSFVFLINC